MANFATVELEVLLHTYYSREPHLSIHRKGIMAALDRLHQRGLITRRIAVRPAGGPEDNPWQTTEKGNKLVEMLRNTPEPVEVHKWVDPRDEQ